MSTEFGGLSVDARHLAERLQEADDEEVRGLAEEVEADAPGAWPEEMGGVSVYADSSLTIPGQSEPPGDCGEWAPREFCKSCGKHTLGPHRCQRRVCEDCWLTWRGNRAAAITERLAGARRAADGADKRLSHCVASPEAGEITTLVEWEQAKSEAYDLAKEKGIDGGVLIPHGWRVKEEVKAAFRELQDADLVRGGIWKWIREHDRDWRSMTYWSPHFHILGLGADIGESDPENDDGWVFSRIDSFDRFELTDAETYEPMFAASAYLLSHGSFETESGKQMVRWFGGLANNQFSLDELEDWEEKVIKRKVAEVTGVLDEDGDGPAPEKECEEEDCEGTLASIFEAGGALMSKRWCEDIGAERQRELQAAFEWAIGERRPPPGLRRPGTREQAEEAFEAML